MQLRTHLGAPHSLADIGIDVAPAEKFGEKFAGMFAEKAAVDPYAGGNLVLFFSGEYRELFARAWSGEI
ncbi:hypothetical protein PVT68_06820 [Microbulbifer bruguierae]|uniref:Uncharacterized protein n=1 Tax=Microbulbifer bruguierae TaxID=3029061 RepID=A0ABY8NHT1_9GAMM|nr:hypothetical protein [Microbulbifer bruguierae]WGL18005.1 hypothetical protein PVT68_06820 [Microbulbifer bruguierae]